MTRRYVPLLRMAVGSLADVYLGVLRGAADVEKAVVLKRAFRDLSADDPAARQALIDEARVATALSHPNIVHCYELYEAEEGLMLAMEYIAGMSLQILVNTVRGDDGELPWPIGARIVADAAQGLAHAHERVDVDGKPLGIVHRDISPKNLVVGEDGWTKLVDFGIARSAFRDQTVHAVVKGTPGYLSPEQAGCEPLDHRTDIYSLGVVLWELLANRRLRARGDTSFDVPELPDTVPTIVADLARAMLAQDPQHRRVDLNDAARLLDDVASGQSGSHADVAAFLQAEMAQALKLRRSRVAAALRGGGPPTAIVSLPEETATFALLEDALVSTGADTVLDTAPEPDTTDIDFGGPSFDA